MQFVVAGHALESVAAAHICQQTKWGMVVDGYLDHADLYRMSECADFEHPRKEKVCWRHS
jgi:hypothetical protein